MGIAILFLSLLAWPAVAQTPAPHPLTLEDCFAAALKRSEVIGAQVEAINQAEEHVRQATGSILPQLNGGVQYAWLDPTGLNTNFFPSSDHLWKIALSQPLFRGFREFAGIRQTKVLRDAQRYSEKAAELQLYKDVVQAFYTVISLEQDRRNVETELGLYAKRIQELRERIRIGRSRVSESLTVESAAASLRAQEEALDGQIQVAREMVAFLTGYPSDTALADAHADAPQPLSAMVSYLGRLEHRPDVVGDDLRVNAAEEGKTIAWGAHLPSADLTADYFLGGPFQRSGPLAQSTWDLQFTVTVPIYAGGVIQSRVREASSVESQSELQASRTRRLAEQEIRSVYESLMADLSQLRSLTDSTALAERNYKEQTREYRLGLVTNLDVLAALTSFEESRRALDRARYAAKADSAHLEAAAGDLPNVKR